MLPPLAVEWFDVCPAATAQKLKNNKNDEMVLNRRFPLSGIITKIALKPGCLNVAHGVGCGLRQGPLAPTSERPRGANHFSPARRFERGPLLLFQEAYCRV